jgi:hypothetical protein
MRDPVDQKTGGALAEARHLLALFTERGFFAPGKRRFMLTEHDRMRDHLRREISFGEAGLAFRDNEREFLLRLLEERPPNLPRKGRKPRNSSRDFWILQVVARLVEKHGVAPTRNREPSNDPDPQRPTTACGIVALVLRELGINLQETGVEALWSRRHSEDFWWNEGLQRKKRTLAHARSSVRRN